MSTGVWVVYYVHILSVCGHLERICTTSAWAVLGIPASGAGLRNRVPTTCRLY